MPSYLDYHGLETLKTDLELLYIKKAQRGTAGGVASLNNEGKVPSSQLPEINSLPTGGTTGQVLAKASDDDHDVEWVDQDGGALIDDTAGAGDMTHVWSANKLTNQLNQKAPKSYPSFTGSVSLGRKDNTTNQSGSIAIGNNVTASGTNSSAFGNGTTASGNQSHAEGSSTVASNVHTHAEGMNTKATAAASHAEGTQTTASGQYSHAENSWTVASGHASHAEGNATIAGGDYQHAGGKFNIEDSTSAEIIGNGTSSSNRSNARRLDWNGNEYLAGDLYVGCSADSTGGTKVAKLTDVPTADGPTAIQGYEGGVFDVGTASGKLKVSVPYKRIELGNNCGLSDFKVRKEIDGKMVDVHFLSNSGVLSVGAGQIGTAYEGTITVGTIQGSRLPPNDPQYQNIMNVYRLFSVATTEETQAIITEYAG